MKTAVILGAGFSYIAGLPLTKDLFDSADLPHTRTKKAIARFEEVRIAWQSWKKVNPGGTAEEWLRLIYDARPFATYGTTWEDALDFALARLVRLPYGSNAPYYHGITTSVDNVTHRQFWTFVRTRFHLHAVVTMNYDILAEQGLKENYSKHRTAPLCFYGGFPYHQFVRKMTNAAKKEYEDVRLGHEVALFKMHGSINWAEEPHGFKIHDDVRAVFRETREHGYAAVVPPMPEKVQPDWLTKVWQHAETTLGSSQAWIVCGYSLPDYDVALRDFFTRAAQKASGLRIYILDPNSHALRNKWAAITPAATVIHSLPGLPDALSPKYWP